VEHDARVLADRIKHHRLFEFGDDFPHDLDDSASMRLRCLGRVLAFLNAAEVIMFIRF
jgi:hypothetical protein